MHVIIIGFVVSFVVGFCVACVGVTQARKEYEEKLGAHKAKVDRELQDPIGFVKHLCRHHEALSELDKARLAAAFCQAWHFVELEPGIADDFAKAVIDRFGADTVPKELHPGKGGGAGRRIGVGL